EGHVPDLLQHARLPPRPGAHAAHEEEGRQQEPHGPGPGRHARPTRAAAATRRARQEAPRPVGRGRAVEEEIARAMRTDDVIEKKRDGHELTRDEIAFVVEGYTRGTIPDYQAAALAMAIFFRGMTDAETVALTELMMRTGEVLDLGDLPGPRVDKHSTGGV